MHRAPRRWAFAAALLLTVAACAGTTGVPSPSVPPDTGLAITGLAGPSCPVETIPPDPACAPRPVAGGRVVIVDGEGREVSRVVLDATGSARLALPAGTYVVRAEPAPGLMGTPEAMEVAVVDGTLTPVELSYDTGIR